MRRLAIESVLFVCLVAAGCGGGGSGLPNDGGGNEGGQSDGGAEAADAKPETNAGMPIPGGGVGGGAIAGAVNVYVLDDATDAPIKGAFVQVGETAATAKTGMTDDKGLVSFVDPTLKAPVTVTAGKTTMRTVTVTDLGVSNVTLTLQPVKPVAVDTAKVRGTVDFTGMPALPSGHYRVAYVGYVLDERLGHPRNEIVQGRTGMVDDNLYAPDIPFVAKTEFVLIAPTGTVDIFALVIDLDTQGDLLNPNGWIFTPTHVGLLDGLVLAKGDDKSGQKIPVVAPTSESLKVTLPANPPGMSGVGFFAVVKRGKDKLLPLFSDVDPTVGIPAPKLEGPFAGSTLWVVATTDDADMAGVVTKNGLSIQRGLAGFAAAAAPPAFIPVVGAPAWAAGEISYTPAAGADVVNFSIAPKGGDEVWGVVTLDKTRTKIHLPELPSGAPVETVPSGDLDFAGQALALPGFDATKAVFRELTNVATGLSEITFTGKK